jgi:hypothetical protein
MESLINAIAQALAAVLEGIGVVGRSRRRAGIRADLDLLKELEGFPDLAPGTFAYTTLQNRIIVDVMRLAGVDLRTSRRDIPWLSVVFAVLLAAGFGYWTAVLNESGFRWYSLFPGVFAGLMFISILGMLGRKVGASPGDGSDGAAVGEQPQVRD